MTSRAPRLAFAFAVLTLSSSAAAQTSAADQAVATALFKDGRALLADGKLDEACPKLAQSYAMDPALGTLLNLAVCHEKQGKIASAWGELNAAADLAGKSKEEARFKYATEQAKALEARLARLVVRASGPTAGLSLRLDGRDVGVAVLGTAMPLDPGEHRIEVAAPGKRAFSVTVTLDAGPSTRTIDVPALVEEGVSATPAPVVVGVTPPPVAPVAPPAAVEGGRSTARFAAGVAVGAVGLVGLGVGGYFGARTFQQKGDIGGNCNAAGACNPVGVGFQQDAHRSATISTVAVAAGLVAVAGGVVLIATSGGSRAVKSAWVAPAGGPGGGGLQAGGAW